MNHRHLALVCVSIACITSSADVAAAPDAEELDVGEALASGAHGYALIVGSNVGGAGQDDLRFAERDAEAVGRVLSELGGYDPDRIEILRKPRASRLWAAFDRLEATLREHRERGEPTVFFFYYSGHSRAEALELGREPVELAALRERVLALPATLRVVVLDACQSGAISRVKGAEPAADFSFNSVARLSTSGVAVMASSTANELSQESERLGASYFTHHLVTGLRGAADSDGDGRISLDEAYRYAYDQTLVSTAASAVGKQHVTLETDLRGVGDVALTFPDRSRSHVVVPAHVSGSVLVVRRPGPVVAEAHKSVGKLLALAVPAGRYEVIVRSGEDARRCEVTLRDGSRAVLEPAECERIRIEEAVSKGGDAVRGPRWTLDLGLGLNSSVEDEFTNRLEDFGYGDPELIRGHIAATVGYRLYPRLHLTASLHYLGDSSFTRHGDGATRYDFEANTFAVMVGGRLSQPLFDGLFEPFVEAGLGPSYARAELRQDEMRVDLDRHYGYAMAAGGGYSVRVFGRLGLTGTLRWITAPTVENELAETHDAGGLYGTTSLRIRF